MKTIAIVTAGLLFFSACSSPPAEVDSEKASEVGTEKASDTAAANQIRSVSQQAVLALDGNDSSTIILDVRSAKEYAAGHVPGAVNLAHDQVAARLSELEKYRGRDIVVYCERGGRAKMAAGVLMGAGFSKVGHLEGDMSGWREAGRAVER